MDIAGDRSYVGFAAPGGPVAVISARCSHMGADLSSGCVREGRLVCPLHSWEYAPDGKCVHVPAASGIPGFARQQACPVETRGGHVFFFNRTVAAFPFPFFDGKTEDQLLAARPFDLEVNTPWYLAAGNGFDVQHFQGAHDRTLTSVPAVDSPHPFAMRLEASFGVTGRSLQDRLTRRLAGPGVTLTIENWGGNFLLVTARLRRTTTRGMVSFIPMGGGRTRVRDLVWVERSRSSAARTLLDPWNAAIRRHFVRCFVQADVAALDGISVHPGRLIPADGSLRQFLTWLHTIQRDDPGP